MLKVNMIRNNYNKITVNARIIKTLIKGTLSTNNIS